VCVRNILDPLRRNLSPQSVHAADRFTNTVPIDVQLVQRNNRSSVGELLLALLYAMILGPDRLKTTRLLQQNGGLPIFA
jgi:hypothetical protein